MLTRTPCAQTNEEYKTKKRKKCFHWTVKNADTPYSTNSPKFIYISTFLFTSVNSQYVNCIKKKRVEYKVTSCTYKFEEKKKKLCKFNILIICSMFYLFILALFIATSTHKIIKVVILKERRQELKRGKYFKSFGVIRNWLNITSFWPCLLFEKNHWKRGQELETLVNETPLLFKRKPQKPVTGRIHFHEIKSNPLINLVGSTIFPPAIFSAFSLHPKRRDVKHGIYKRYRGLL